jgi:hypothetical protein
MRNLGILVLALAALSAAYIISSAVPSSGGQQTAGGSNWRNEPRCQPPGGGLSPEQVLPDRDQCPEAYRGNGDPSGAPALPNEPPSTEPVEPPSDPCGPPALNGFPCYPVDPRGNPGPYYPPETP